MSFILIYFRRARDAEEALEKFKKEHASRHERMQKAQNDLAEAVFVIEKYKQELV